ncbi:MAG: hypothetical protein V1808_04695 [Candidatus Daviesbacteria bacterium]
MEERKESINKIGCLGTAFCSFLVGITVISIFPSLKDSIQEVSLQNPIGQGKIEVGISIGKEKDGYYHLGPFGAKIRLVDLR